jgi:hypothetical protein
MSVNTDLKRIFRFTLQKKIQKRKSLIISNRNPDRLGPTCPTIVIGPLHSGSLIRHNCFLLLMYNFSASPLSLSPHARQYLCITKQTSLSHNATSTRIRKQALSQPCCLWGPLEDSCGMCISSKGLQTSFFFFFFFGYFRSSFGN